MEKIKVNEIVVVEGKYDAIKMDSIIDGLIIPVNGFSIFQSEEKKALLKTLGEANGIILITDSDTAGFKIRTYIQNICNKSRIINVYIPNIEGKESRKSKFSKEGFLGVEGINKEILLNCLKQAGVSVSVNAENKEKMTYLDLFELGLSGTKNAAFNREKVCKRLSIPNKLSKKALLEVLNRMSNKTEINNILQEKPIIFWDFHGTLTLHVNQWIDSAYKWVNELFPQEEIKFETLCENLCGKCLPWWTYPDRDTRHLIENDGWWNSCREEFIKMFSLCGLEKDKAEIVFPHIRADIIDSSNHPLYDDTIDVLTQLKNMGYKNYIISNNFPELKMVMDDLKLSQYFEEIIVSANIGYDKPRKEIFEYAMQKAGNPDRCIMVGDNPVDDIMGAKSCGFTTLFLSEKHESYPHADYVCKTLTQAYYTIINI